MPTPTRSGGPGADALDGRAGPDTLEGGPDGDDLHGGGDVDRVSYPEDAAQVVTLTTWPTTALPANATTCTATSRTSPPGPRTTR